MLNAEQVTQLTPKGLEGFTPEDVYRVNATGETLFYLFMTSDFTTMTGVGGGAASSNSTGAGAGAGVPPDEDPSGPPA